MAGAVRGAGCTIDGACRGCGTTRRPVSVTPLCAGTSVRGFARFNVGMTGRVIGGRAGAGACTAGTGLAGFAACAGEDTVGGTTTGGGATGTAGASARGGATVTTGGRDGGATLGVGTWGACSACRRSRIALATSPGLDARDRSTLGLPSLLLDAVCRDAGRAPLPRRCVRTRSASSSSIELECVFFSVTPTAVSASRISLLLTSSSRARSLMRTLLIRPRSSLALC